MDLLRHSRGKRLTLENGSQMYHWAWRNFRITVWVSVHTGKCNHISPESHKPTETRFTTLRWGTSCMLNFFQPWRKHNTAPDQSWEIPTTWAEPRDAEGRGQVRGWVEGVNGSVVRMKRALLILLNFVDVFSNFADTSTQVCHNTFCQMINHY